MARRAKEAEAGQSMSLVPVERVERAILFLRGEKVILDADLADLYGVTTRRLNEQVRRNRGRVPSDFVFQLTSEEFALLRSHFATSNPGRG
ncbi:MAG TPA: ORF6N domain-containing protein, partial [Thermoanaerobaculia bacterium]|nr:ORF6N domain-containing protein [Thermoanaerobaculia bacterium]